MKHGKPFLTSFRDHLNHQFANSSGFLTKTIVAQVFLRSINAHKYNVYNGDKNEVIDYVITLQGTKIYDMFILLTLLQHGVLPRKEHVQARGC